MARYTDELDTVVALEQALRLRIAERIALENGIAASAGVTPELLDQAEAAIAAWQREGEEQQDLNAFRRMGPLQDLLAEHRAILDRIDDIQDRRLS